MKTKKYFHHLATVLISIGVFGLLSLSYGQATLGNTCPLLGSIPACYPLLVFAIITLLSHLLGYEKLFGFSIAVPILIAIYASVLQLNGLAECPSTDGGIPTCYISFLLFGSAAVSAWMSRR